MFCDRVFDCVASLPTQRSVLREESVRRIMRLMSYHGYPVVRLTSGRCYFSQENIRADPSGFRDASNILDGFTAGRGASRHKPLGKITPSQKCVRTTYREHNTQRWRMSKMPTLLVRNHPKLMRGVAAGISKSTWVGLGAYHTSIESKL